VDTKPYAQAAAGHITSVSYCASGCGHGIDAKAGMETMPAYLVRLRANRDLVGIFVADDPEELEFVVYECTDVEACE
jgi:hypothetical protein